MSGFRLVMAGAAVAAIGFGGVALAADTSLPAPLPKTPVVVKPATPWHGLYVGGGGGYAWATIDGHAHLDPPFTDGRVLRPGFRCEFGSRPCHRRRRLPGRQPRGRHLRRLHLVQRPQRKRDTGTSFSGDFHKTFSADIDTLATVGGRLGFTHSTNSLLYGLAGWSWGKGSLSEFEGCEPDGLFCDDLPYSGSVNWNGWTVGAGIERMFHSHLSAQLEYRFTHLSSTTISGNCTPQNSDCGASYYGEASATAGIHTLRAALVFRFGGT